MAVCVTNLPLSAAGAQSISPDVVETAVDAAWAKIHAATTIPGAVVAVVTPDRSLLIKGYGVRDIATQDPVDPHTTLFQVGSVTKVFTALLAARALDAGRISLDGDLRGRYADLVIADDLPQPVTVRQLLTHTAGFDGDLSGVMTDRRDEVLQVDPRRMQRHLRRMREPGILPVYDNTGAGLLGEVAARGFGHSFRDAMREQVLAPLAMDHSSIGLPEDGESAAAACHRTEADGRVTRCRHTFMRPGFEGAGALATTGADMAKFMAMLLNDGRTQSGPLLKPETFAEFDNVAANRFAPGVGGLGWLIEETVLAGRRALFHTGGYDGFSSGFYILTEQRLGIFVSVEQYAGLPRNQEPGYLFDLVRRKDALAKNNGYRAVAEIAAAIAELTPNPETSDGSRIAPESSPAFPPASVAGFYRSARSEANSFIDTLVLGALFGTTIKAVDARTITVNGQTQDWQGAGLYKSRATGQLSAFKHTKLGLAYSADSSGPALETSPLRGPLSAGLFILALLLLLVASASGASLTFGSVAAPLGFGMLAVAVSAVLYAVLELQVYPALFYGGYPLWPIVGWRLLYHAAMAGGLWISVLAVRLLLTAAPAALTMGGRISLAAVVAVFVAFFASAMAWGTLGKLVP